MALAIGIVGLPNVGKSTLFNALTDNSVLAANYPFATIEPNTGVVSVPDDRLDKLASLYKTNKIVPATVTFVDIAGLVAGASQGEGLGNQFLSHIRTTNAIVHVVRAFHDSNVQHVNAQSDPKSDIDVINTELVLADLQTVDRRLPQLQKIAKADPKLASQLGFLSELRSALDNGQPIHSLLGSKELTTDESVLLHDLQLLSAKPVIYVFNVDEAGLSDQSLRSSLSQLVTPAPALLVCAKLEDELRGLDKLDSVEMLGSYGVDKSGLELLIQSAYTVLGLQSFLTAGEKEVRAWTIIRGSTAPQAASVIHGDFERGFIAAEVVDYKDLLNCGSLSAARAVGKLRTEGKSYIMQPNDVVEFRFNVSH